MVCLAVNWYANTGMESQAGELFRKLTAESRKEPGCIMYLVHTSPGDPRRFFIYEQYTDAAALQAHRDSAHFALYAKEELPKIAEVKDRFECVPLE